VPNREPTPPAISTRVVALGMERADGTLSASELYDVATMIGMSEQQVRLCLRRLVLEGQFTQEGRGRAAVFRATGRSLASALPEVEFLPLAYAQDAGEAPWDGAWRLLILTVAEAERRLRDQARLRLAECGAAALGGGVYVSPLDLSERLGPLIEQIDDTHGRVATATARDLTVAGEREPRRVAELLWPVQTLAQQYTSVARNVQQRLLAVRRRRPPSRAQALTQLFACVAVLAEVMSGDPLLPPELLPSPWPGARARAAADDLFSELAPLIQSENPVTVLGWVPSLIAEATPAVR
jgi:phenylacetic acid degradation operon negative regulatory protein